MICLRLGAGDELRVFPRRLLLGRVLRGHDDRAAAGRECRPWPCRRSGKTAVPSVNRLPTPSVMRRMRAGVSKKMPVCPAMNCWRDASKSRIDILPSVTKRRRSAHHLAADVVVERDLGARVVEHAAAGLVDDRLEEPGVRPHVHVVRHAGDARRRLRDLAGQRDHAVPGVRHARRIAARLLHELGVEVHDRQRRVHREPVLLAVDLAELDHRVGVVRRRATPRARPRACGPRSTIWPRFSSVPASSAMRWKPGK